MARAGFRRGSSSWNLPIPLRRRAKRGLAARRRRQPLHSLRRRAGKVMSVRLFVGNLPYSATEVDIREHFGTVGNPTQIVIPMDRETGRPRGFAFVDYDDRGMAERAVQQLHGQPFKGRPLSVSEARPREARPPMGAGGPPRPMGGPPRPGGFSSPRPPDGGGDYRAPRGDFGNRNFGPNKPPKGRGSANFSKKRQQEGQAK